MDESADMYSMIAGSKDTTQLPGMNACARDKMQISELNAATR
jgi:hypothetical protein